MKRQFLSDENTPVPAARALKRARIDAPWPGVDAHPRHQPHTLVRRPTGAKTRLPAYLRLLLLDSYERWKLRQKRRHLLRKKNMNKVSATHPTVQVSVFAPANMPTAPVAPPILPPVVQMSYHAASQTDVVAPPTSSTYLIDSPAELMDMRKDCLTPFFDERMDEVMSIASCYATPMSYTHSLFSPSTAPMQFLTAQDCEMGFYSPGQTPLTEAMVMETDAEPMPAHIPQSQPVHQGSRAVTVTDGSHASVAWYQAILNCSLPPAHGPHPGPMSPTLPMHLGSSACPIDLTGPDLTGPDPKPAPNRPRPVDVDEDMGDAEAPPSAGAQSAVTVAQFSPLTTATFINISDAEFDITDWGYGLPDYEDVVQEAASVTDPALAALPVQKSDSEGTGSGSLLADDLYADARTEVNTTSPSPAVQQAELPAAGAKESTDSDFDSLEEVHIPFKPYIGPGYKDEGDTWAETEVEQDTNKEKKAEEDESYEEHAKGEQEQNEGKEQVGEKEETMAELQKAFTSAEEFLAEIHGDLMNGRLVASATSDDDDDLAVSLGSESDYQAELVGDGENGAGELLNAQRCAEQSHDEEDLHLRDEDKENHPSEQNHMEEALEGESPQVTAADEDELNEEVSQDNEDVEGRDMEEGDTDVEDEMGEGDTDDEEKSDEREGDEDQENASAGQAAAVLQTCSRIVWRFNATRGARNFQALDLYDASHSPEDDGAADPLARLLGHFAF